MKALNVLATILALSSSSLFAANFMHYHPDDRLPRAQAEPDEVGGDKDMTIDAISQTRFFAESAGLNKFFLTTAEYKQNNQNFLVEMLGNNRVRVSYGFRDYVKVANIDDQGLAIGNLDTTYNFVITAGDQENYEVTIFTQVPPHNTWMEFKGPKSIEMIEKYKKMFIGLFFKTKN